MKKLSFKTCADIRRAMQNVANMILAGELEAEDGREIIAAANLAARVLPVELEEKADPYKFIDERLKA